MIAVGVSALLVVAALSAAFVHFRSADARAWVAAIERSRDLADRAMAAYRGDSDRGAAEALRLYLDDLSRRSPRTEPWKPPADPLLDARALAFERTLTGGRLAMVETRLGHVEAAEEAWAQAERHARSANLDLIDRESLKEMILKVDRNAGLGDHSRR